MFANRLRKNARHRRKWARRAGVSCYRLYDRDIPEVPLAVDWYDGRLHVAEFVRPDDRDADEHEAWLDVVVARGAEALQVAPEAVYLKRRQRQKGASQYERQDGSGERFEVTEGGLRFWVNLRDYLDTGLFLDHRQTRAMVRAEAEDRRVLNLFAYSGTFSVYAADGGARATTTVDLSNTYCAWARDNLALNGHDGPQHRVEQADVLTWLDDTFERGDRFDLVVLDPPTFSNSKRMRDTWDVQRDHPELLASTLRLLSHGGVLYFSTNARRFRLEPPAGAAVTDLTAETVPPDFTKRPHRCWRMVRS
ncbi:MAG: class I SAM-dependent methyltransferase [Myxococcales bacterium]|nr:class I SAM-dependent methyltransferase [Myxococcales bacterium]